MKTVICIVWPEVRPLPPFIAKTGHSKTKTMVTTVSNCNSNTNTPKLANYIRDLSSRGPYGVTLRVFALFC